MFSKIIVALDGSTVAESVLPHAREFANHSSVPVDLLSVINLIEIARSISAAEGLFLDKFAEDEGRIRSQYLDTVAKSFSSGRVHYRVLKGNPADVIIESAAVDKEALIAMATHGRSGVNRWLLGSVAEKVLRGTSNPLLLIRSAQQARTNIEAGLKSIIVPLDGSELAESVLPTVEDVAKNLDLEVIFLRVYAVPYGAYSAGEGFYDAAQIQSFLAMLKAEAVEYLETKAQDMKKRGLEKVSIVVKEGLAADEIISLGRHTPDNLVAMCTHGRSGVKRWVFGSVTETVVRHSGDPVLILRPPS